MILSLLGTLDDHADSAHLEKLYSGVAAAAYTGLYFLIVARKKIS